MKGCRNAKRDGNVTQGKDGVSRPRRQRKHNGQRGGVFASFSLLISAFNCASTAGFPPPPPRALRGVLPPAAPAAVVAAAATAFGSPPASFSAASSAGTYLRQRTSSADGREHITSRSAPRGRLDRGSAATGRARQRTGQRKRQRRGQGAPHARSCSSSSAMALTMASSSATDLVSLSLTLFLICTRQTPNTPNTQHTQSLCSKHTIEAPRLQW